MITPVHMKSNKEYKTQCSIVPSTLVTLSELGVSSDQSKAGVPSMDFIVTRVQSYKEIL